MGTVGTPAEMLGFARFPLVGNRWELVGTHGAGGSASRYGENEVLAGRLFGAVNAKKTAHGF